MKTGFLFILTLLAFASIVSNSKANDNQNGGRPHYPSISPDAVKLSKIHSQGILHLPDPDSFHYSQDVDHYHEVVYYDNSQAHDLVAFENLGVSVAVLELELAPGDYVEIEERPLVRDHDLEPFDNSYNNNRVFVKRNQEWKQNVSLTQIPYLEFKKRFSVISIVLRGNWTHSNAKILVTFFYDIESAPNSHKSCPRGMLPCYCANYDDRDRGSSEEYDDDDDDDRRRPSRCIPEDLFCNGVANCGPNCNYDETDQACATRWNSNGTHYSSYDTGSCAWSNFEYLLMLVMTGLLFLLIPIAFIIILMYHRKASAHHAPTSTVFGDFDRNNNVEHNGQVHHVISTVPVNLDAPPSYDDLPEEVKVPYVNNN